jgi:hypothetical protein
VAAAGRQRISDYRRSNDFSTLKQGLNKSIKVSLGINYENPGKQFVTAQRLFARYPARQPTANVCHCLGNTRRRREFINAKQ